MRKITVYLVLIISLPKQLYAENISGKSYLSAQTFNLIPMDITWTSLTDQHFEEGTVLNKPKLQVTLYGGRSTNIEGLRSYFLFNNKTTLIMNELPVSDVSTTQDIVGANFNIYTQNGNQSSAITMSPQQKFIGTGISGRYGFKEKWWFLFEAPYLSVENNLNLEEVIINDGGGINPGLGLGGEVSTSTTMIGAFNQPGMLYGKISGKQKAFGFSDITVLIGYDFNNRATSYFSPYVGLLLPASNKPTAEFVWEPILGNNKHFGFIGGLYGHTLMYSHGHNYFWFSYFSQAQFLMSNTQKRSFDLKRGPWTRYLAMYADNNDRTSSTITLGTAGIKEFGINLMTKDVHVSPGVYNFAVSSLSVINRNFNATAGITGFIKPAENLSFVEPWKPGPIVADFLVGNDANILRTISDLSSGAEVNTDYRILSEDINMESAASDNVIVGGLYFTIGYYRNDPHTKLYEVGGALETAAQNNGISRYSLWGKFQITF